MNLSRRVFIHCYVHKKSCDGREGMARCLEPSSKTNIFKFQFEQESRRFVCDTRLLSVTLSKQSRFIYLFVFIFKVIECGFGNFHAVYFISLYLKMSPDVATSFPEEERPWERGYRCSCFP